MILKGVLKTKYYTESIIQWVYCDLIFDEIKNIVIEYLIWNITTFYYQEIYKSLVPISLWAAIGISYQPYKWIRFIFQVTNENI